MHAVPPDLLGLVLHEPEADLGLGAGQQGTTLGILDDLPPQDTGPEARQALRVVRAEGEGGQSRGHVRTLGGPPISGTPFPGASGRAGDQVSESANQTV